MTFIIGEDIRVAAARDRVLLGLKGRVVLETMNTITISTETRRKVMLPKSGSALELKGGTIVLGDDLAGRLEDRLANSRTGRQTR